LWHFVPLALAHEFTGSGTAAIVCSDGGLGFLARDVVLQATQVASLSSSIDPTPAAAPDLTIVGVDVRPQGIVGITIKNQGGAEAGPFLVQARIPDNTNIEGGTVRGLAGGATTRLDVNCQTGTWNVSVAQRSTAVVPEVNTANNSTSVVIASC
jgi:hypothetical protein